MFTLPERHDAGARERRRVDHLLRLVFPDGVRHRVRQDETALRVGGEDLDGLPGHHPQHVAGPVRGPGGHVLDGGDDGDEVPPMPRAAAARIVASIAAPPAMSYFIFSIPSHFLREMPPVSKVTPSPTRAVHGAPGAPAAVFRDDQARRRGAALRHGEDPSGLQGGKFGETEDADAHLARRGGADPAARPPRGARQVVGPELRRRGRHEGAAPVDRLADPGAPGHSGAHGGERLRIPLDKKKPGDPVRLLLLVPVELEGRQGGAEGAEARGGPGIDPARARSVDDGRHGGKLDALRRLQDRQDGLARVIRGEFILLPEADHQDPRGGETPGGTQGKGFPELPREVAVADRRRDRAPDRRIDRGGRPAGPLRPLEQVHHHHVRLDRADVCRKCNRCASFPPLGPI